MPLKIIRHNIACEPNNPYPDCSGKDSITIPKWIWHPHPGRATFMKPRLILVSLGLAFIALIALGLQAQEQTTPPAQEKDKLLLSEQLLKAQFQAFTSAVFTLQKKLALGTPKERQRAEQLAKVLKECNDLAIDQEFTKLLDLMSKSDLKSLRDLEKVKTASDTLAGKLQQILELMQEGSGIDFSNSESIRQALKDLN